MKKLLLKILSIFTICSLTFLPVQAWDDDGWWDDWDDNWLDEVEVWPDDSNWLDEVVVYPDEEYDWGLGTDDEDWWRRDEPDWENENNNDDDEPDWDDNSSTDNTDNPDNGNDETKDKTHLEISTTNELSKESLAVLESIIKELLGEKGYKELLDFVKNNPFHNIRIDNNYNGKGGLGGYYPTTETMVFISDAMMAQGFREEMIHHIQNRFYGGIGEYDKNYGLSNIEFEAKVIQDLLCIINGNACPMYGATGENSDAYMMWLLDASNYGEFMPDYSMLQDLYYDFLNDFNNDPNRPNYNSVVVNDLIPQVLNYLSKLLR